MSNYQPQTPVQLTRRTEKRLNSLERRANPGWRISELEGRSFRRPLNPNFRTNQRVYVSGTSLPPESFGHDCWRAAGYINLFTNPSFETNATGLTSQLFAMTRVTSWAASGTTSIQGVLSGADSYFDNGPQTLFQGATYTVSATARLTAALTGAVQAGRERRIVVIDIIAGTILASSNQIANVAGVDRLSVTFTVATSQIVANIRFRFYGGHAAGTIWYDALMLTRGTVLYPYMDGSTGGAAVWTGTAHASTSYSQAASSYTFVANTNFGQTITLASVSALSSFYERAAFPAATYTFAWDGTATARIYNKGNTAPGAFAASPITQAIDGTDDVVIEITAVGGTKTFGNLRFDVGSADPGFRLPLLVDEMADCQWYYRRYATGVSGSAAMLLGQMVTTTLADMMLLVSMRAKPVVGFSTLQVGTSSGSGTVTAAGLGGDFVGIANSLYVRLTCSPSPGAANLLAQVVSTATSSYLDLNSEVY